MTDSESSNRHADENDNGLSYLADCPRSYWSSVEGQERAAVKARQLELAARRAASRPTLMAVWSVQ